MKLTTKQNDELAVRKGRDKEGVYVELLTEDNSQYILTPWEAVRLGNALIEAAQPKQKKDAPHRGAEGATWVGRLTRERHGSQRH